MRIYINALLVLFCMSGYSAQARAEPQPKTFRDCADCPEMVIIPTGSFEMGSETGYSDEKPVHKVTISGQSAQSRNVLG